MIGPRPAPTRLTIATIAPRAHADLRAAAKKRPVFPPLAISRAVEACLGEASSPPSIEPRRRAAPPASKLFIQAFPNPALFSPNFSKDFFGGFVGFQGLATSEPPFCPPPNILRAAPAPRR
jgi:hypothetical protein